MGERMNRRECLRALGLSGVAGGLGLSFGRPAPAQQVGESSGFQSSIITSGKAQDTAAAARLVDGKVIQPRRELPVLHETDVLVVGAGPAGVVAALAAQRAGANVTLVERYGHFGGLWTGGLVLLVIGHIIEGGKQVCQGIGEEIMRRLDKLDGAIVDRRPGVKYVMVEMIEEAGVDVFLHCWGVDAIVDGDAVRGAVFESKQGRQAILAKVVVDATGDGDVFAAAGAEFNHCSHNIGLVSRIGNLDRVKKVEGAPKPRRLGNHTPIPGVNWVNLTGPELDGLDVRMLTRMELNHRKYIWSHMQKVRQTPGYDKVYLMETAPQLGVRVTRLLNGLNTIRLADLKAGSHFADVVGVGGSSNGTHGGWQIRYGTLVPTRVDNVLAAGRCISTELSMVDLVRLIPNCFVTGHAAGVAAAVAVQDDCTPRHVEVPKVQKILKQQEAYLG